MGAAGKKNIHYMTQSLSKYVNMAAMMREVGGILVTHSAELQLLYESESLESERPDS